MAALRKREKKLVKEFSMQRLLFITAQTDLLKKLQLLKCSCLNNSESTAFRKRRSPAAFRSSFTRCLVYHTVSVKVCQSSGDTFHSFPQLSSSFWPFVLPVMCCFHSSPSNSTQTTFVSETVIYFHSHILFTLSTAHARQNHSPCNMFHTSAPLVREARTQQWPHGPMLQEQLQGQHGGPSEEHSLHLNHLTGHLGQNQTWMQRKIRFT